MDLPLVAVGVAERCPYCHGALDGRLRAVACARCRTLQHAECWAEHGRCATFACEAPPPLADLGARPSPFVFRAGRRFGEPHALAVSAGRFEPGPVPARELTLRPIPMLAHPGAEVAIELLLSLPEPARLEGVSLGLRAERVVPGASFREVVLEREAPVLGASGRSTLRRLGAAALHALGLGGGGLSTPDAGTLRFDVRLRLDPLHPCLPDPRRRDASDVVVTHVWARVDLARAPLVAWSLLRVVRAP